MNNLQSVISTYHVIYLKQWQNDYVYLNNVSSRYLISEKCNVMWSIVVCHNYS